MLQLELPPDRASPSIARAAIAASCRRWGLQPTVRETAQLVVSELVANVVVHASTPLLLAAEHDGSHLTIAVADGDISPPVLADPEPSAEGGRGVGIVAQVAAAWGVRRTTLGKLVWVAISVGREQAV